MLSGTVAKPIDLARGKQACQLEHITIRRKCETLTRTQSLSCRLQNLFYYCRVEVKVVNKMRSRGRMKARGQEIQRERGDWVMRRRENKVKSEDILIFILVF